MTIHYNISNIKMSLKLKPDKVQIFKTLKTLETVLNVTFYNNFAVFKKRDPVKDLLFVFTCFNSGHINITKIQKVNYLKYAIKLLKNIFRFKTKHIIRISTDNITANGYMRQIRFFKKTIDGININDKNNSHDNNICSVRFDPNHFSGAVIKFGHGSIILFPSGKFICIGCKTIQRVNRNIEELLKALEGSFFPKHDTFFY